ncbi:MAG TPA: apolipoprotein N-acyltransferase [Allosphingosinicella sp.]|nr:apolipoprotein N-acyltransferase [Allosphingosinicella sp.]
MKPLLLAFLLGLLSALGFAPLGLWPLTLAAFAGLMWLVERAPSLRSALARGYWFGVGNFVLGLNWIATAFTYQSAMPVWLGWVAVVLLSFYLAVYPAMAAGLAWRWGCGGTKARPGDEPPPHGAEREAGEPSRDPLKLVLIFAASWLVTEWLRATMFTGFAWNPIGVTLLPTRLAYLSTMIGTYGLSAIALLLAGALLLLLHRQRKRAIILLSALAVAGLLVPLAGSRTLPASAVPLRIVQPNIGQQDKWKEGFEARNLALLKRLSKSREQRPRLLLWPEAAVTDPLQNGLAYRRHRMAAAQLRRDVGEMIGPSDLLLTGGVTWQSADGSDVTSATNSVFAMNSGGRILGRYDKAHLVPYGEYLPARPILSRLGLSRLAPGDIDFDSGPGPQSLVLPLVGKVGFQLCYEIIFSGEVIDRRNRPNILFNPSNDAWFGAWGSPQHLAQARLRALEEGMPVLRSTPTGISAVIDSEGRLLHSLPWRTAGVIDAQLPAPKPPTLFARGGNVLPFVFALLLVGIAIAVSRKGRYGTHI